MCPEDRSTHMAYSKRTILKRAKAYGLLCSGDMDLRGVVVLNTRSTGVSGIAHLSWVKCGF